MKLGLLTALTLTAFAANSLLCRGALDVENVDAAAFTLLRLGAGAIVLFVLLAVRGRVRPAAAAGSWISAWALFGYAVLFSFAYRTISAGAGALVLFAAVQITMLIAAVRSGEGPRAVGWLGLAIAIGGLVVLTRPGAEAPDLAGVVLMAGSGISWGVYSLRGRHATNASDATTMNFVFATLIALPICFFAHPIGSPPEGPSATSAAGMAYAIVSGAVTSGLGYTLWYAVLPTLGATRASVLQLAVPVIATLGGAALLHELITTRVVIASLMILGGIAVVLVAGRRPSRGASAES